MIRQTHLRGLSDLDPVGLAFKDFRQQPHAGQVGETHDAGGRLDEHSLAHGQRRDDAILRCIDRDALAGFAVLLQAPDLAGRNPECIEAAARGAYQPLVADLQGLHEFLLGIHQFR